VIQRLSPSLNLDKVTTDREDQPCAKGPDRDTCGALRYLAGTEQGPAGVAGHSEVCA
jgi:hypothetical protein